MVEKSIEVLENRVKMSELERRCGKKRLHSCLIDEHCPTKKTIDDILKVTGLSYEECFKEEPVAQETSPVTEVMENADNYI